MKELDLKKYEDIDIEDLVKISDIYDRIEYLICTTNSVHEDLIEYMVNPFVKILKHHGLNLNEYDPF